MYNAMVVAAPSSDSTTAWDTGKATRERYFLNHHFIPPR
jgi:hypothetical protein